MNRTITLECNCRFHQITIEQFDVHGEEMLSICIYEHKSGYTGKLLKKPKLLGDVVLDSKQIEFIKSAFKNE
jgi:hypothetical protein